MKRSTTIVLVATTVALTACDAPQADQVNANKFDAYNSKEECLREWNGNEDACQKRYDNHSRGLVWVGPHYINGAPAYVRRDGTTQYRQSHSNIAARPIVVPPISSIPAVSSFRPSAGTSVPSVSSRGGFGATASAHSASSGGG